MVLLIEKDIDKGRNCSGAGDKAYIHLRTNVQMLLIQIYFLSFIQPNMNKILQVHTRLRFFLF